MHHRQPPLSLDPTPRPLNNATYIGTVHHLGSLPESGFTSLVSDVVRTKALAAGAAGWLRDLSSLVANLEAQWSISVGETYLGGTEAFVARAELDSGESGVLKLMIPRPGDHAANEILVLEHADGRGCPRLYRSDLERGAMLLERLGPSMFDLGLPIEKRHRVLCDVAAQLWTPASALGQDISLPTGAYKADWLANEIVAMWEELDRPCSERAVDHALECAHAKEATHDDERAVLVHGDVHQWNALQSGDGFKLVDPDGLLAEPEYDLGIIMREDPLELMRDADPKHRAHQLAAWTGLDAESIWQWGVIERVSTGLLATKINLQPVGAEMLKAADHLATKES